MPPKQTLSPVLPAHKLDPSGVVKVLLSIAASNALRAVGERHLAIITEPDATAPQDAGNRLVLVCLPLTQARAFDSSRVALGTHEAVGIKPPAPPNC